MSEIIIGDGVNGVLSELLWRFNSHVNARAIEVEDSRNGPVYRLPGVTQLVYMKPWERVLFSPARDANPFFHLMEAFWMLAGDNYVRFPAEFNKRFLEYSDDGVTVHGAYGYRWHNHFPIENSRYKLVCGETTEQIMVILRELAENPASRRAVLQMWDPVADLGSDSKDVPCNLGCCFDVDVDGFLNMTVFNRSNDALWGACGANAVHMSMLQELIAGCLGYKIGKYRQVSNNMHIYADVFPHRSWTTMASESAEFNVTNYSRRHGGGGRYVTTTKIFGDSTARHDRRVKQESDAVIAKYGMFMAELDKFMGAVWGVLRDEPEKYEAYKEPGHYPIIAIADLMAQAWFTRKLPDGNRAAMSDMLEATRHVGRYDWLVAGYQWMQRRQK